MIAMTDFVHRPIATDCYYFLGDRPCVFHKQSGALCTCTAYRPISERVLVVKLDAMGDVLRTTALLPALARQHPGAALTWITRPEAVPLLQKNPYIHELVPYGPDATVLLGVRTFDRVINLDAGKVSAGLASMPRSAKRDGYVLSPQGIVEATNREAQAWLETGVFDDIKRAGTSTYQDVMLGILGLAGAEHDYVLHLDDRELAAGRRHLERLGVDWGRPLVGVNTGAGGRWELKQWREDGFVELMRSLSAERGVQFVLLGGPGERERNQRLATAVGAAVLDPGCDNPVRHFAALVDACDVVVTGDTLAMHIALARGRRLVVLFGPTSAPEIELYGRGSKVLPDMTCLSCYKMQCDFVPNCMDLISVAMVREAVERELALAPRERPAS